MMRDWFQTGATWVPIRTRDRRGHRQGAPDRQSGQRRQAFAELQTQVQEQAPWLFLWTQVDIYGVSKNLQWQPRGDEQFDIEAATWNRAVRRRPP